MPPPLSPSLPLFISLQKKFMLQLVSLCPHHSFEQNARQTQSAEGKKIHLASLRSSYGGEQIHWPEEITSWKLSSVATLYGCDCTLVCIRSFSPFVMLITPWVLLGYCPKGGYYEEDVCAIVYMGACGVNADSCIHGSVLFFLWAQHGLANLSQVS